MLASVGRKFKKSTQVKREKVEEEENIGKFNLLWPLFRGFFWWQLQNNKKKERKILTRNYGSVNNCNFQQWRKSFATTQMFYIANCVRGGSFCSSGGAIISAIFAYQQRMVGEGKRERRGGKCPKQKLALSIFLC